MRRFELGTSRMSDWDDDMIRLNITVEEGPTWYGKPNVDEVYMIFNDRDDFDRWIEDLKKQADEIYKNKNN